MLHARKVVTVDDGACAGCHGGVRRRWGRPPPGVCVDGRARGLRNGREGSSPGGRHVDHRGVDVGQAVEDQRRLVGDDGTSPRPGDGKCEIVVLRARQDGHPVHPSGHVLEETAAGEQAQLRRIDACLSSLERRDVAVVIGSCLHESVGLAVAGGYRRMCVVPPILCTLLRQVPGGSSCKDP